MNKTVSSLLIIGAVAVGAPVVGLAITIMGAAWPVVPLIVGAGAAVNAATNSNAKDSKEKDKDTKS